MVEEKGSISIHTENIFPIIKKSLYSDTEIFVRELASNGVDACQKLKKLSVSGEAAIADDEKLRVNVKVDKEAKTITFEDNGLGMTADEVKKYINQIAFSGATEFLQKHQKDATTTTDIIGNFGLGFYSSFMVADKVELDTKSYKVDSEPVLWTCDGSTEFSITNGSREERGTKVTLHVAEDSEEFLDEYRIRTILEKFCKFLPISVQYDGEELTKEPLWTKAPNELKDEDYLAFYKELYPFSDDPLFWIHLNVDYPFNLTGILFFPKVGTKFEVEKEKIRLYSRQVFITEDVKGIVPEFLTLLHGVIDSPDIPLNVSRSYLQTDGNVRKISAHILKKVSDRLGELFNEDRAAYEAKWDALGFFVKYGMVSEPKFQEKAKAFLLVENIAGERFTLEEYQAKIKPLQTDKDENLVLLYTQDKEKQVAFIDPLLARGYDILSLDQPIDPHFIGQLEQIIEKSKCKRVDTESPESIVLKQEETASLLSDDQKTSVEAVFKQVLDSSAVTVKLESLLSTDMPVSFVKNEFAQRYEEMARTSGQGGGMFGGFPSPSNLLVNANHALITKLAGETNDDAKQRLAQHLIDLAYLAQGNLNGKPMMDFLKRSIEFLN